MNRTTFALRWGRKLIFGISWPLSSLLMLIYFKSFILPVNKTEFFYVIFTILGHIGLINSLVYFLIYVPIAWIFPTYYITRIWSLFLILFLNLFILIDGLNFSIYQEHVYGYLFKLLLKTGITPIISNEIGLYLLAGVVVVMIFVIWIRGEMVWRQMQARFSNPVSNWYLILILCSLVLSKALYRYGQVHPQISNIFPFNFNLERPDNIYPDQRKFFYPSDNLNCVSKINPNLVMIMVHNWDQGQIDSKLMPKLSHIAEHGMVFHKHMSPGLDNESGKYALMYSIPHSYQSSSKDTPPAIYQELKKRNYRFLEMNRQALPSEDDIIQFTQFIENADKPFYALIERSQNLADADQFIHKLIIKLQEKDLLKNTHIVIAGSYSPSSSFVPLMWISPDKKSGKVDHVTSHYDVAPALMERMWGCKKAFKNASIGQPLSSSARDWLLFSGKNQVQIMDFKKGSTVSIYDGKIFDEESLSKPELVFSALKKMTQFNKP